MSVANDNIYFGSRYRGRMYVVEADSLLLRGQLVNTALESPTGGGAEPERRDGIPAAIDPIGNPAIADGWLYVSYGNGYVTAFANYGGGGYGTDIEPPDDSPFNREGSRRNAIPMPEIRVTDTTGNPITDEERLRFDWGQPVKIIATFQNFETDSLSLETNPIRVTIRGPMGDLPPVTVSPSTTRDGLPGCWCGGDRGNNPERHAEQPDDTGHTAVERGDGRHQARRHGPLGAARRADRHELAASG